MNGDKAWLARLLVGKHSHLQSLYLVSEIRRVTQIHAETVNGDNAWLARLLLGKHSHLQSLYLVSEIRRGNTDPCCCSEW